MGYIAYLCSSFKISCPFMSNLYDLDFKQVWDTFVFFIKLRSDSIGACVISMPSSINKDYVPALTFLIVI
ncbi:unnamed protein product [Trifolium pratense]|uniref:Uncharacterized protein n=1 Tax=Trifolium pratense TaxID=57577 RepID=A0ACB0K543_TRIPR|nr:unnamed protein product [Trifolium pratense]